MTKEYQISGISKFLLYSYSKKDGLHNNGMF
jgi:hypothetical protein